MNQKVLIFGDQCINKYSLYKNKRPINIDEVEIEGKKLFRVESYGNKGSCKYYTGYKQKTDPFPSQLHIKFPKMNAFVKYFDNNNINMNLLANDKELLKNIMRCGIRLVVY